MVYTPKEALAELMAGNRRYMDGKVIHLNRSHQRREEVAARQFPLATLVGCSDSRVPLEVIFDQGFGDLFVIRCAGNVVGPLSLASIEFSLHYLKVPVIMVLGHKRCSAVQAALHGEKAPGHIPALIKAIHPAVKPKLKATQKDWDKAIKANVAHVVKSLPKQSKIIAKALKNKSVVLVGGIYDLDTGKVVLF